MSGAASPARVRTNAPASPTLDVSMPFLSRRNRATLPSDSAARSESGWRHVAQHRHRQVVLEVAADAGQVVHDVDLRGCSSAAGPTPESIRSCGELMAPPLRITSRLAPAVCTRPVAAGIPRRWRGGLRTAPRRVGAGQHGEVGPAPRPASGTRPAALQPRALPLGDLARGRTPYCSSPLKSGLAASPASMPACTNARLRGLGSRRSATLSGPPVPW